MPKRSMSSRSSTVSVTEPTAAADAFPIGSTQLWVGVKAEGGEAEYRLGFSEVKWKSSVLPLPEEG